MTSRGTFTRPDRRLPGVQVAHDCHDAPVVLPGVGREVRIWRTTCGSSTVPPPAALVGVALGEDAGDALAHQDAVVVFDRDAQVILDGLGSDRGGAGADMLGDATRPA